MCGVAGIASSKNFWASYIMYLILFALQHRGQEAAGMGASQDGEVSLLRDMGTIDWVFRKQVPVEALVEFVLDRSRGLPSAALLNATRDFMQSEAEEALERLSGNMILGHTRYSTTGASGKGNAHPIPFERDGKLGLIGHNGNGQHLAKLREIVDSRGGYTFEGTTDTELLAALLATSSKETFYEALLETLPLFDGSFSLVVLYDDTIYAAKDRFGIRPLCVGKTEDAYIVASETCALDIVEAEFVKELEPGELVTLRAGEEPRWEKWYSHGKRRSCAFELIYFARPDSVLDEVEIHAVRKESGRGLARYAPVYNADLVISVPDSGDSAAEGYGEELACLPGKWLLRRLDSFPWLQENLAKVFWKIGSVFTKGKSLFARGLLRGHFVGRTFMEPVVAMRQFFLRVKHNPLVSALRGKVVVVVDDSIVRGTTTPRLVRLLKRAGAREVHLRIAAPPLVKGCHLGVDLPNQDDLVAASRNVEEVRRFISEQAGVELDSLAYLPLERFVKATSSPLNSFCHGCLEGGSYAIEPEEGYNPERGAVRMQAQVPL